MAKAIPQLHIALDFGGSGTKVAASLNQENAIYFLMPPHCTKVPEAGAAGEYCNANSLWVGCGDTYYAVGILAEQSSGSSIKVKPLKVESAPAKTLAALVFAAHQLGLSQKFFVSVSIVIPSGESHQYDIYEAEIQSLLEQKITSPWGSLKTKLRLFNADIEGKGILLYHRQENKSIKNTLVLMLGYRNASFIATKGELISAKHCSDIGFHSFLQKVVSLTAGYSIERLLVPVSRYRIEDHESSLHSVLRFDINSPHRPQELAKLKAAIEQAEVFYLNLLLDWLGDFLSIEVDDVVLAGGSASYIGYRLSEKLVGRIVPSEKQIFLYEGEDLPPEISQMANGDRFLDIYGIWREVSLL